MMWREIENIIPKHSLNTRLFNSVPVPNVYSPTSDTEFSERIFALWKAGKIFPCQRLDLNLSQ